MLSLNMVWFIRYFHQSQIPNLPFFFQYLLWFLLQLASWQNTCFEPIRSLFSNFNFSNWEKFVEKISETNGWNYLMNSWQVRVNVNPLAADDHMKEVIQQLQLMGEVIYVKGSVCVDVIGKSLTGLLMGAFTM